MKTRALFLVFALVLILPASSNGQVGNLLKNKLNRAINAGVKTADKETNKEIDTAVEKGVLNARDKADQRVEENKQNNAVESGDIEADKGDSQDSQENQGQSSADFGKLFGNKVDLKYKEEYGFSSRIYMVSETYEKKEVIKVDFFMYYSSSSPSVGMETKTISNENGDGAPITAVMVMDGENKSFIMLTDINGMKMGIISPVPDENSPQTQPDGKPAKKSTPPTFTKTGNTRVIAGYKCDEYTYTDVDDESKGKVWFTKDVDLKIDKRGWKSSGMDTFYGSYMFNEGVIMATESYDNKGTLISKSETKEINPTFPHSISVAGYTLRQMNMGQ